MAGRKGLIEPVLVTEHLLLSRRLSPDPADKGYLYMEIKKTQGGYYFRRSFLEIKRMKKHIRFQDLRKVCRIPIKNMIHRSLKKK